jgi:hypothetical protein
MTEEIQDEFKQQTVMDLEFKINDGNGERFTKIPKKEVLKKKIKGNSENENIMNTSIPNTFFLKI